MMALRRAGHKPLNFAGFQSETRTIEALKMRIDYQTCRWRHSKREKNGDWEFSYSFIHGDWDFSPVRPATNLDPYAIRSAFEDIKSPDEALCFLSEAGKFWNIEKVTWSQFREWQRFFSWLRMSPEVARKDPIGAKAWDAASGLSADFFSLADEALTEWRYPPDVRAQIDPHDWREIVFQDRRVLWALRRFALHPEGPGAQARISLGWYEENGSHVPEDWKAQMGKRISSDSKVPFLRVEAQNIIESIAATIYADHAEGLRYGRCKHCHRHFKIESAHGQEFCAAPAHLQSSPCKNAFLQAQRRKNEKRAVAFVLQCWTEGQSKTAIGRKAAAEGIRLNPAVIAKAQKKHSKTYSHS